MNEVIQVAGIRDMAEAEMLCRAGVDWLGFPLRLPLHAEDLSEDAAARIIATLPRETDAVLITYLDRADEVSALCGKLAVRRVQLHGPIVRAEVLKLRAIRPDLYCIKSLVVRGNNVDELREGAAAFQGVVDGFITDTHDPRTGADGATGLTHDWRISMELVHSSRVPLMLAGGLSPENVYNAIMTVSPAGVDAHTGLEDERGRKDPALVRRFVAEARRGFAELRRS